MQLLYFESENKKNLDTVLNTIDAHTYIFIHCHHNVPMCFKKYNNHFSKVTKIQKYNNLLINLV